jgi:PAS domain S-box-containing protein
LGRPDLLLGFIDPGCRARTPHLAATHDLAWLRLMAKLVISTLLRHRAEQDKRDSLQRFEALFESIADAVVVADDATGTVVSANAQAAALFGRPVHALVGLHFTQLHPPQIHATEPDQFEQRVDIPCTTGAHLHETLIRHADGHDIPVEISSGRRYKQNGKSVPGGRVSRHLRTQAPNRRHWWQPNAGSTPSSTKCPQAWWPQTLQPGSFTWSTMSSAACWATPAKSCWAKHRPFIHPPEEMRRIAAVFGRIAQGEGPLAQNITVLRKNGSRFPVDIQPVEFELDGVRTVLGVFIDVTRIHDAMSALQASEAQLRTWSTPCPTSCG